MVIEDVPASSKPVKNVTKHFPVIPDFHGASYQGRYEILCRRLMLESFYTAASVITTTRAAVSTGDYRVLSELTGLETFLTAFASHIAAEAAQFPPTPPTPSQTRLDI